MKQTIKIRASLVVATCLIGLAIPLLGCGGGSQFMPANFGSGSVGATGRVTMTITWPAVGRLIPQAAQSIRATITSGSSTVSSQLVARPIGSNTTNVSFGSIPVGNVVLTATAFPLADGSGTANAQGATPVTVVSGQTTPVTVTMGSTVNHVELSPLNPSITQGGTQQMVITAKDGAGNVVLLSASKLNWQSSNTAIATVSSSGLVSAVAAGSAQLTVTDTESQKSASTNLTIQSPTPVSWWKAENNVLDAVGGNNGAVSGGLGYTSGHIGQGFAFNGVDSVINLGDPNNLKITGSITIDAWIKISALPNSQLFGMIVFRGDDRDGIDPYFLGVQRNGTLDWQVAAAFNVIAEIDVPITIGVFHHVTATLDNATGDMRLYIDGILGGQLFTSVRPAHDLDPSYIGGVGIGNVAGAPQSAFSYPFSGVIDELKIYNQVVLP